jgi:hypothetical protein
MTPENLKNKICPYVDIAKKDIIRDPSLEGDSENPKLYGYAKCLKCNGFNNKCEYYNELIKLKLI